MLRILQFDIPQRLIKLLKITLFDLKTQNYFGDIVMKTIDHREKTKDATRNDLIDLLIEMKNNEMSNKCDYVEDRKDAENVAHRVETAAETSKHDLSKTRRDFLSTKKVQTPAFSAMNEVAR